MQTRLLMAIATLLVVFGSCVDRDYDIPPTYIDIDLEANITIGDLVQYYKDQVAAGNDEVYLDTALIIKGTVISDDTEGNFYKQLVLQDSTGGIEIRLDMSNINSTYQRDAIVYVECKGLYMGDYGDMVQLGGSYTSDGLQRLPGNLAGEHLVTNNQKARLAADTIDLSDLGTVHDNTLIAIKNVEFQDISQTYGDVSDPDNPATKNLYIQNCFGLSHIVRSSGYSSFAGTVVASCNGTITAVKTSYRGTPQLVIRDTADVQFTYNRCDGTCGSEEPGEIEPVDEVDEDFSSSSDGSNISLTDWTNIAVAGNRMWQGNAYNTELYAQATGYNSNLDDMETWLITPPVTNIGTKKLYLKTAMAYWTHTDGNNPLTIYISTDFVGDNFETATWTELDVTIADQNSTEHAWIDGELSLAAYSGTAAIAFKYKGSNTESTSYRLDDIYIGDGEPGNGGETGTGDGTKDNPYTVDQVIAGASGSDVWVKGYIVGCITNFAFDYAAPFETASNIILATAADETTDANCVPVQLVSGSAVRTAINLVDNEGNYQQEVLIRGDLATYFSVPGLKETDGYWINGAGVDPDNTSADAVTPTSEYPANSFFYEKFENVTAGLDLNLEGWTNVAQAGTELYQGKLYSNNKYAQFSAYSTGETSTIGWLVSPAIDLTGKTNPTFTFDVNGGYDNGATLEAYVLTDYSSGNPWDATATKVSITLPAVSSSAYNDSFSNVGNVDLSAFSGTIRIAIVYTGGDGTTAKTTTWQVDNINCFEN